MPSYLILNMFGEFEMLTLKCLRVWEGCEDKLVRAPLVVWVCGVCVEPRNDLFGNGIQGDIKQKWPYC